MAAGFNPFGKLNEPVAQTPGRGVAAKHFARARRKERLDPGVVSAKAVETPVETPPGNGMQGIVAKKHLCVGEADPCPDKIFASFLHRRTRPPICGMRPDGFDGIHNVVGRERTAFKAF